MRAVGKLEPWRETRKAERTSPARSNVLQLPQERNSDYWEKRLLGCKGDELAAALKDAAVPGNLAAIDALYKLVLRDGTVNQLFGQVARTIAMIASPPLEMAAASFVRNPGSAEGARAARYITRLIDRDDVDCRTVADKLIEALGRFAPEGNGHSHVEHLMEARQLAYALLGQLDRKNDSRAAAVERTIDGLQRYEDPRDEEYGKAARQLIDMLEGKR